MLYFRFFVGKEGDGEWKSDDNPGLQVELENLDENHEDTDHVLKLPSQYNVGDIKYSQ